MLNKLKNFNIKKVNFWLICKKNIEKAGFILNIEKEGCILIKRAFEKFLNKKRRKSFFAFFSAFNVFY